MQFSMLVAALLLAAPLAASPPAKGSQAYAQGRALEQRKDWSGALAQYQKAAAEDPANLLFQIAVYRAGFEARQAQKEAQAGASVPGKDQTRARIARIQPAPELQPLSTEPIDLKLIDQSPKTMFETVCKYSGINLVIDPEYQPGKNLSLDLKSATIDQALDFLASTTRSFWKPLSSNTILLTNDNPNKRRDYEQLVTRTFYLSNVNTPAELQEIVTTIRTIADLQRVTVCNNQFASIARG